MKEKANTFASISSAWLIAGDGLTLLALTIIGFATHGETGTSFIPRMAAIWIPLLVSWFLLAPALGLFRAQGTGQVWRVALGGFFAAQLAVILRGLILHSPVIPIFGLVLGGTSALGMVVWRGIAGWLTRQKK